MDQSRFILDLRDFYQTRVTLSVVAISGETAGDTFSKMQNKPKPQKALHRWVLKIKVCSKLDIE